MTIRPPAPVKLFVFVGLICILSAGSPAGACDTPVFRYALENWPADPYGVLVFYRDKLTDADSRAVDLLEKAADLESKSPANCRVFRVNVSEEMAPEIAKFWESQNSPPLPWVTAVYPPRSMAGGAVAWSGPLTPQTAEVLLDSPARREAARRLMSGQTCVWILVESGQAETDNKVAALLESVPAEVAGRLADPDDISPSDRPPAGTEAEGPPETPDLWKPTSSVIRLSRKDAAEAAFLQMLLRTEEDLQTEYAEVPIAFPLYGRGRVLFALVDKGICRENIAETCEFLIGPCACEIKMSNPGLDLLFSSAWNGFEPEFFQEIELPSLAAVADAATQPATVPADEGGAADPASSTGSDEGGMLRNVLLAFGAVVVVAVALTALLRRRAPGG